MKLSIIVPCYNEADSVEEFYNNLKEELKSKKVSYEVLFIDDGSKDDTMKKLEIISSDKNVKVISFSRNFGKEAAMYAGLKNVSGDYVAIMDADMQHTPKMLFEMFEKLKENDDYDVVCAYKADRSDETALKRTLTSMFYKINNKISEAKLLPGASDFRIFKSYVKDAIISLPENRRFLKGIFSWIGFNTIYVPYQPEKRMYGTSKWSLFKLLNYSLSGIISFSTMPLKFIFFLSIIVFIIGVFNFILMGYLSMRTVILFLSLIMLSIGILCAYIRRMYKTILSRPSYIEKRRIGFDVKK